MPGRIHPRGRADAPVIVRIAGLPLDAVDGLSSELGAAVDARADLEARLDACRAELGDRLHEAVRGAPRELRAILLATKRDCHNGRSILSRTRDARWPALVERAGPAAERLASMDREAAEHDAGFESRFAAELARTRRHLLAAAAEPGFRRGLALASPDLFDALRAADEGAGAPRGRSRRKAELSLLRYVTRAATKLSPFSTLTRVGLGTLSDAAPRGGVRLAEGPWSGRSLVRVRSYLLRRAANLLQHHPPFRNRLRVVLNDSICETESGRFLFLRPAEWTPDAASGTVRYDRDALVTADLGGPLPLRIAELLAGERPRYGDLVAALEMELGAGVRERVDGLVASGALRLLPPWPANEPHLERCVLAHLRTLPADAARDALVHALERLVARQAAHADSQDPGASIRAIAADAAALGRAAVPLARLPPEAADEAGARAHPVSEDVWLTPAGAGRAPADGIATVPRAAAEAALRNAELLVRLGVLFEDRHEFRLAVAAQARERWGGRRDVGVVESLHALRPLWQDYARFHFSPRRPGDARCWNPLALPEVDALNRWREAVRAGLRECGTMEGGEHRIAPEALRALLDRVPAHHTDAGEWGAMLMAQPAAPDGALWVMNLLKEGTGRIGSRYTPAMDDATRAWYTAHMALRGAFEVDGEPAELLDVPGTGGNTLDLHHPQTPALLTLPGEEADLPPHRRVRLRDLRLAFDGPGGLPRLRGRDGRRFVPVNLGTSSEAYLPVLQRYLCAFGPSELMGVRPPVRQHAEGEVTVGARTVLGNLVVHRRRWTAPAAALRLALGDGASGARAFAALHRQRTAWGLPDRVFFEAPPRTGTARAGKPQYLDFTSPLFLPLLRDGVRERDTVTFTEMLPDPGAWPADEAGRRWAVELVLDSLALRRPAATAAPAPAPPPPMAAHA